jgi:hypothetical protein
MKITRIVNVGVAALSMGAFFGVGLPAKAEPPGWVRAPQLNFFEVRGLVPPGSCSHNENQKPATIAVNKAGQGIGEQKQTTSKAAKKGTQHVRSATSRAAQHQ